MNVAFCSSEIYPFSKTGGMADVCGALPLALAPLGVKLHLFMPQYKRINTTGYKLEAIVKGVNHCLLAENVHVYFIENNKLYDRDGIYGDGHGDFPDNLERFQYFNLRVLELIKELNLKIDLIHGHDWQTALIPVLLKEKFKKDPFYKNIKTLLTIHNLAYQGLFPADNFKKTVLDQSLFNPHIFEFYGKVNVLKGGLVYTDRINTVSPQYSQEILTKDFGCGLEGVLLHRKNPVVGILNGLDYDVWNPATDSHLKKKYTINDFIDGKSINKNALQKQCRLPEKTDTPLFAFVGRISHQKGIDLILNLADILPAADIQIVIQGMGDAEYQRKLIDLAKRFPEKVALRFEFDEAHAHQTYAGSDFFLMPSSFEPCGLSQLISLRYGSIPIVYKTGGLADTIKSFNPKNSQGNGFLFTEYTDAAFHRILKTTMLAYKESESFSTLIKNAMQYDFSWEKSAQLYFNLYKECLHA